MIDAKTYLANFLRLADVQIQGTRPWDIQVHNERLYSRILAQGSLGFGDAYIDGWWDCEALDELLMRLLRTGIEQHIGRRDWRVVFLHLQARFLNRQSKYRAGIVGRVHYDLGNQLYQAMLAKRLMHSCAYWKSAKNLDAAQDAKLELCCKKLGLQPGMRVLDIGCGWGGFALYAAQRYDVQVVGITISEQQVAFAKPLIKDLPVEIRLQDYRELHESFDRIISIGMFEHVGNKNYATFLDGVRRHLTDDGLIV